MFTPAGTEVVLVLTGTAISVWVEKPCLTPHAHSQQASTLGSLRPVVPVSRVPSVRDQGPVQCRPHSQKLMESA